MKEIVLSQEQRSAVDTESGAIAVSAGAGSGKTEVVAHRIERILSTSAEEDFRVLAVSYTVRAADSLRKRLADRLGELHKRVDADTIHGFALTLIRQFGTRVGLPPEPEILTRDEDRAELLQAWLEDQGESPVTEPARVLMALDNARARCRETPYLETWRNALASRGALDYPAILDRAQELLEAGWVQRNLRRTYRHVVIDEAQNLTRSQYQVIKGLVGVPGRDQMNIMMVGDERQSIVGFAGAEPELMAEFAKEYAAERIILNRNYRSAKKIVAASSRVAGALSIESGASDNIDYPAAGAVNFYAAENEVREGVAVATWVSEILSNGLPEGILAPGEEVWVRPEDVAVLGRTAASLRYVRRALDERAIEWSESSTEDEWVSSETADCALSIIRYCSAPNHITTRKRLLKAAGVDGYEWDNGLAGLLLQSSKPEIRKISEISFSSAEEFVSALSALDIEEDGWLNDLEQIHDAWSTFVDRYDASELTFGNFNQHIFRLQRGSISAPGVRVMTVHKAQGREFKVVALVGVNEGQFPDFRAKSRAEVEAELRTFYVALSRASRLFMLTYPRRRSTRYGERSVAKSPFLDYILDQLEPMKL